MQESESGESNSDLNSAKEQVVEHARQGHGLAESSMMLLKAREKMHFPITQVCCNFVK